MSGRKPNSNLGYFAGSAETARAMGRIIRHRNCIAEPKTGWGQARLKHLPTLDKYADKWDLIRAFLRLADKTT